MTIPVERIEARWLRDPAVQALNVDDAKHVIEALVLATYADLVAETSEAVTFDTLSMTLPFGWNETAALSEHAESVFMFAAGLDSDEDVLNRVDVVAESIPASVHDQVFGMLVAISVSDNLLQPEEISVLTRFAEKFGFDQARTDSIFSDIVMGMGLVEED